MKFHLLGFLFLSILSCSTRVPTHFNNHFSITSESDKILSDWYLRDIQQDSIPGISLERAYSELIEPEKMTTTSIIAVIDTEIDINHEDLRGSFWINKDEVAQNENDDDQNDYVDDIQGWNFLGNKNGENVLNTLYEYVRIVNDSLNYKNLDKSSFHFKQYMKSKEKFSNTLSKTKSLINVGPNYITNYSKGIRFLKKYISDTITKVKVDNLIAKYPKLKDSVEGAVLWLNQGVSYNDLVANLDEIKRRFNYHLNSDYNDRAILNDDPQNINDKLYGNAQVSENLDILFHGTAVSGLLVSKRNNGKGINGFGDFIKIMPVCISANGDENDKDMALAIRYAVDNGANIINISSGKYYSGNYQWVQNAIQYASSKDVLIVVGAGNDNINLDDDSVFFFPNDINPDNQSIISNNFIRVGASSYGNDLKWKSSNYGKDEVDLFAPGDNIFVTFPFNKYDYVAGTSFASPLVAGVAALIRSLYPSLTAPEVKKILMDSSVKYDIMVDVPTKENPKQQLPFSELSKSGGIVNAYNALVLAEKISKNKL